MRTIYYGGDILTMELPLYVEAVLTENGKIKKVGTKKEILSQKQQIKGISVICANVKDADVNTLKTMGDQLKIKLCSGVIILASGKGDKVNLIAMATDDVIKKGIHAGNIVKAAAVCCGGGGGGRPNMAQAGGKDASKIEQALQKAKEVIQQQ